MIYKIDSCKIAICEDLNNNSNAIPILGKAVKTHSAVIMNCAFTAFSLESLGSLVLRIRISGLRS